jgi:hypothetical protein
MQAFSAHFADRAKLWNTYLARIRSSSGNFRPLERNRVPMRVMVPIGVIVAVAIFFVVIAVLSSAQRANDVAADNEQQLFMRAIMEPSGIIAHQTDDEILKEIGWRLGLRNLRRIDAGVDPGADRVLQLTGKKGEALAQFAWTPNTPGREIISRIVPFVMLALSAFVVLAALVFRHMRSRPSPLRIPYATRASSLERALAS